MRIAIGCGREILEFDVPDNGLVASRRQAPAAPLADPAAAVRAVLEHPIGFPALRQALIPDDHVVVVVDEQVPAVGQLLMPILEHIELAHVPPQAVTLLCPPGSLTQPWLDDLSDAFQDTRLEVHDPSNRKHLSYLAATRHGRRIYLNRTLVDADQVVLLTGRRYDSLLGYAGAEGAIYPDLSDDATRREYADKRFADDADVSGPLRREAGEVVRLLGTPFMVQIIEGADAEVIHVLGGPQETAGEGQRLLDARWRVEVDAAADVVVAGMSGDPARQTFADMARALACAARVVKPRGRIVLACAANPALGKNGDMLRKAGSLDDVLDALRQHKAADLEPLVQWTGAARHATIYLLSGLPAETAEEMFTTPLEEPQQLQRLLNAAGGTSLFLPDAHKTMAVVTPAP